MIRPVNLAILGVSLFLSCLSHATGESPNVTQKDAQVQPASVPTIRTYSNLVVVDVVVTDAKGAPVIGLPRSAFSLTEDNKLQTLESFEEHNSDPAATKMADLPKLPPGLFSNQLPAPDNGPVNVLLLDYLNTPADAHLRLHAQLIQFLKSTPPGTRVAVIGLSNGLSMLQGFTSDKQVLEAALASKNGLPQISSVLGQPMTGESNNSADLADNFFQGQSQFDDDGIQATFDAVKRFEAMRNEDNQIQRALDTLDAFNQLARYLEAIPGRKNVLWFSAGFPLVVQPDLGSINHPSMGASYDEDLRRTDNLLTQAQIAVYPIDIQGLQTDPTMDANYQMTLTQLCAKMGDQQQLQLPAGYNGSLLTSCGASVVQAQTAFQNRLAAQHLTMEAMAEETGGKAFYNTNDFTGAMRSAMATGASYYTLSYSPGNQVWDERFRSIKVNVGVSGVNLGYRTGYYAVDPENQHRTAAQGSAMQLRVPTTMDTAMLYGGPEESQILFKERVRPSGDLPSKDVLAANHSNPGVSGKGPFRAYGVDLVPDIKAVDCKLESDGNRHCSLELWTYVYNTDGEKLIGASNSFQTTLTPAEYAKVLTTGMAFHQEISVPVKGRYFLRTAIHDLNSDRVGALEIPVSAVANLAPLKAAIGGAGGSHP